jgi:hypothetical protein
MEMLALAVLAFGAVPLDACEAPPRPVQEARPGSEDEAGSYAAREALTPDLAEFRGGNGGVILGVALIVALVVILAILIPW